MTVRYAQLQNFGTGGLATQGVPTIGGFEYEAPLPWNGGMQMMLPWVTSLDVAYTGHHNVEAARWSSWHIRTADRGPRYPATEAKLTSNRR